MQPFWRGIGFCRAIGAGRTVTEAFASLLKGRREHLSPSAGGADILSRHPAPVSYEERMALMSCPTDLAAWVVPSQRFHVSGRDDANRFLKLRQPRGRIQLAAEIFILAITPCRRR
jgi:hypothetical protein